MPIYKRGKTWWVHINAPDGRRIRQSAKTESRQEAIEFHDQLKAECWRVLKLGERPRKKWQCAVERWLKETQYKASQKDDIAHLRWLHPYFYDKYLDEITRDFIDEVRNIRQSQGVSNATVNRMFEVVRAILRRAEREWDWLDRAPTIRMLKEPKKRVRWLTEKQANKL